MAKIKYVTAGDTDRFQFHRASDAAEVTVDEKGYSTDDPAEIAYLDTVAAVKRSGAKPKDEED